MTKLAKICSKNGKKSLKILQNYFKMSEKYDKIDISLNCYQLITILQQFLRQS